ncbi:abscisic acid and environmental stress-inducible protein-like [Rhododendron vialii]|uniref:abscisic acid and environmental stress-inducible protein-like n=1 Tax=Rhododendron vialii TaxID=182163 RepID=UPI00265E4EAE|nr:abscisic acid and environmental stress-inducible protein-like [Rhododendron vialii]
MGSKTIVLFLGLLLATLVFITSEVTARDLVETSKKATTAEQKTNGVEDAKNGSEVYPGSGFGGNRGSGNGGGPNVEGRKFWDFGGGDCCQ